MMLKIADHRGHAQDKGNIHYNAAEHSEPRIERNSHGDRESRAPPTAALRSRAAAGTTSHPCFPVQGDRRMQRQLIFLTSSAFASYFDGHFVRTSVAWKYPSSVKRPLPRRWSPVRSCSVRHRRGPPCIPPAVIDKPKRELTLVRVKRRLFLFRPGPFSWTFFLPHRPAMSVYSTLLSTKE